MVCGERLAGGVLFGSATALGSSAGGVSAGPRIKARSPSKLWPIFV